MGTRSLSGVVIDGQIKASYSQFDGYPDGVGTEVLRYARRLASLENLDAVKQRWRDIVLVDADDSPTPEQLDALAEAGIRSAANVSTGDDWYAWLRENQGLLQATEDTGFMIDSKNFGFESLFCEWAWLVDLDERTLECYVGFQKEPVTGRFAGPRGNDGYYGVKLIRTWSIDDLPLTDEGFVAELNALTAGEEDGE